MLNPLNKRLFRELKADFGKYFVIFFVMVLAIAEGSGFLVAASSMLRAYDDGFVKYNIEDGNFRLEASMSDSLRRAIENNDKAPVKIYENFYIEDTIENGSKIRLYKNRKDIDRVSVLQGRLPQQDGEIAIDRMYADNNKFDIGSEIIFRKAKFKVVGLVALSDYSALFEDNGDVMFDATEFGVAVTTGGSFDAFNKKLRRYQYSYKYKNAPKSEKEEKDMGEDFLEALVDMVSIENFQPAYSNQAITYTGDDFVISKAFSEKFRIGVGDKVKLAAEYDDDKYEFTVTGIYDYDGSICAFMDMKTMNSRFDLGDGYFSGYFSNKEINDIPEEFIGTVIDYKAMTKISRQMKVSMGGFMKIVQIASVGIFVVLVYILSKIIIERNASSISMAKILGYWNREVSNLYINATTAVALITIVIMVILERGLLVEMFHIMLRTEMNGWFNIVIKNSLLVRLAVIGIVTYGVVAGIEYYKVKKIPLDEALKNGE
ncbi:ABC transporter permease [Eubacterium xylanophilum]|uniref:ABC transporter permease n=1 Tax=Eubacterium xylanophilum TaxID=39497 RepID=UPI000478FB2B|nr:ABC transporter permease [Eubacterium xylanophilum]